MTKLANSCYSDRAAYNRHVRYNSSISCIRHRDAANVVRPIFVWKKAFTVPPPLSFFGFHDGRFLLKMLYTGYPGGSQRGFEFL